MRDITAPLRGNSLHDGVAVRLLGLMFDGALGPGEFIDVRALAAAWQVSRTPLRLPSRRAGLRRSACRGAQGPIGIH